MADRTLEPPTSLAAGVASLLLGLALAVPPANAQGTPDAQLQALMNRAATQFQTKDFKGALASLQQVDARTPLPIVRFNIARCLQEMGQAREAVSAFEHYLKLPDEEARQLRARETIARLESTALGSVTVTCAPPDAQAALNGVQAAAPCPLKLRRVPVGTYELAVTHPKYLPHADRLVVRGGEEIQTEVRLQPRAGVLVVKSKVPGAEVWLDDVLVSEAPTGEVELPPREYRILVRAPGHDDWTRKVTIAAGERLELEAQPAVRGATPLAGGQVDDDTKTGGGLEPLPIALSAGAGAALIAGAVFYLRTTDDIDRVERHESAYDRATTPDAARTAWSDAEAAREDAQRDRLLTWAFLGAGVALTGAATWAFLSDDGETATRPGLGLAATPDGAALGFSGQW